MFSPSKMALVSGLASRSLCQNIALQLQVKPRKTRISQFSDGEIDVEILENVRGDDMFIVQSTSHPAERNLMELALIADACRRASAHRITAVIPYFGYARQDRRVRSARVPISAKVVADILHRVGVDRVLTVDLHSEQIQGFFNFPVDNVYATPVLFDALQSDQLHVSSEEMVVVSPDIGGVVRARAIAKRIGNLDLAIIDKRRSHANHSEVMHLIGDVAGKHCVMIDDIVDTAGTLCQAAQALKESGATKVYAYATHAVLSGGAIDKIAQSSLDKLLVTDTITHPDADGMSKIHTVSIAPMLAWAIERVNRGASLSKLF